MYRHVIWDWNGTLLDDAWLCVEIINGLLDEHGLSGVTAERYGWVFGFPLEEYCRKLGFALNRAEYEVLSDRFIEIYETRRLECLLREEALETLDEIAGEGVAQSLLSAYREERLKELVRHFDLGEYFAAVIGVDNHYGEGKVERGRRRIAEMGCCAEEVLMVGDTLHDMEVARAMGIACVLVPSGHQHERRLLEGGARVAGNLKEVVSIVGGSRAVSGECRRSE